MQSQSSLISQEIPVQIPRSFEKSCAVKTQPQFTKQDYSPRNQQQNNNQPTYKSVVINQRDGSKTYVNVKNQSQYKQIDIRQTSRNQQFNELQIRLFKSNEDNSPHTAQLNKFHPHVSTKPLSNQSSSRISKKVQRPFATINTSNIIRNVQIKSPQRFDKSNYDSEPISNLKKNNEKVEIDQRQLDEKKNLPTIRIQDDNYFQNQTNKNKRKQVNIQDSKQYQYQQTSKKIENILKAQTNEKQQELKQENSFIKIPLITQSRFLKTNQNQAVKIIRKQLVVKLKQQLSPNNFMNRTLQCNLSKSLSPKCKQVTDRLFNSRINKIPCPKYKKQMTESSKLRFNKTVREYGFVGKYLDEQQTDKLFMKLKKDQIPQYKWPSKIVDTVYRKIQNLYK